MTANEAHQPARGAVRRQNGGAVRRHTCGPPGGRGSYAPGILTASAGRSRSSECRVTPGHAGAERRAFHRCVFRDEERIGIVAADVFPRPPITWSAWWRSPPALL